MSAPVRIALLTAASRATAMGNPLNERDGLAILLEALRFSARRGISIAEEALCIDAEGKLSLRTQGTEPGHRDPARQVQAACAFASALFEGNPPLPLEPGSFPTIEQMIVAAELRVLRSGDARLATQSEARRAAAALFARALEPPRSDPSEVITDKLPVAEATPPSDAQEEPLLSEIPGLSPRDLHREVVAPPMAREAAPPPQPAPEPEMAPVRAADPLRHESTALQAPVPELRAAMAEPPSRPPRVRGRWMLPTALLLATASALPIDRRNASVAGTPAPEPVPEARHGDEAAVPVRAPPSFPGSAKAPPAAAASPKPAPSAAASAKETQSARASSKPAQLPPGSSKRTELAAASSSASAAKRAGNSERAMATIVEQKLEAGERALQAGRYFQAIVAFRDALEGPAPLARAARRLGDVYLLQEEPEKAAAAYRRYLELAPDAPDADEVDDALAGLEER